jgi:hypothetical protein
MVLAKKNFQVSWRGSKVPFFNFELKPCVIKIFSNDQSYAKDGFKGKYSLIS